MRLSKEKTAENKARVLDAALSLFAERGFADVAVSELMAKAGLTHGGFYNHFESKTALEAEACEHAFASATGLIGKVAATPAGAPRRAALALFVERYLSTRVRDAGDSRCPMVAFATDVSRESAEVQARYTLGMSAYLDTLATAMESGRAAAMALLAELVGALTLARSVAATDRALSDELLAAARTQIVARLGL
jgi:TetR/AcrR family transcriptional regulator, transcriptional repressor for nem operon